jgi:hypothetical protein
MLIVYHLSVEDSYLRTRFLHLSSALFHREKL